jgi:hypothetical protein
MGYTGEYRHDRLSDRPFAVDLSPTGRSRHRSGSTTLADRLGVPRSWVGMSGYLIAGVVLGLVLILVLSFGRGDGGMATAGLPPVTDNIVHLHARDIGNSCWQGYERLGPARLTVALEVGVDGKIRYAAASGETPAMRGCVESHIKAWEFLPQAQAQTMAIPFEVDRR